MCIIGKIMNDKEYLKREYPDMEYWKSCHVIPEVIPHKRPIIIDHPDSPLYYSSNSIETKNSGVVYPISPPIVPRIYVQFIVEINEHNVLGNSVISSDYMIIMEILPQWSKLGSSRFLELVYDQYFTNMPFFRSIKVNI